MRHRGGGRAIVQTRALSYDPRHALNAICPYFTMFPLEYPLRVLAKHRAHNPVVMDPFCGRGTTLYAARILGLPARGIDSSPIAIAIAKAKLSSATSESTLELARELIGTRVRKVPDSEFFRLAFHPTTLRGVCAIREGLLGGRGNSEAAVLLRAAMLGCLHGPKAKRPAYQAYFSNQMPRTFSSKPEYSVRYWRARGLRPPLVDVLTVLERKLSRIEAPLAVEGNHASHARPGDSRTAGSLPTNNRDFSVVVTSPPYYGMRTYIEDHWLRNWFLGGPSHIKYGDSLSVQVCHGGAHAFTESLGAVWRNMSRTRADRLDMYVRFGTIPSTKVDPRELMMASLEDSEVDWTVLSTRPARTAASGKRQAAQMTAESAAALEYDFHIVRE